MSFIIYDHKTERSGDKSAKVNKLLYALGVSRIEIAATEYIFA